MYDGGLGGAVGAAAAPAPASSLGGYVDDLAAAPLLHVGRHGIGGQGGALDVHVEGDVPVLLSGGRRVLEPRRSYDAGGVDQDVDPAEALDDPCDHPVDLSAVDLSAVGDVDLECAGPVAETLQLSGDRLGALQIDIRGDGVGATLGHDHAHPAPYAAGAARDEHYPILHLHVRLQSSNPCRPKLRALSQDPEAAWRGVCAASDCAGRFRCPPIPERSPPTGVRRSLRRIRWSPQRTLP